MQDITLWIGGYPATEIAAHTPPSWELLADGGTGEVSFALALSARSQHPALRPGSLVQVLCGGRPVAYSALMDPDRTTWECKAYGLQNAGFLALDAAGNVTRDLGVAIAQAIARGWRVRNPAGHGVGYTVPGDSTEPQAIGSLITEAAVGQRWGIRPDAAVYVQSDPTEISYRATPDSAIFGTTNESTVTHLVGVYFDGTTNQKIIRPPGLTAVPNRTEEPVDLTGAGTLTSGDAAAILDGMLKDRTQVGVTNGVTLHREQLMTVGGTPAFLAGVQAGLLVRADGLVSARASVQTPFQDFVIGKTKYTAGSDNIYLEPVNASPIAGGLSGIIAA